MSILSRVCNPVFLKQFLKFVVVGIINTAVDFLVLNLEIVLTGITEGPALFALNAISFGIATTNSYFLNKYWTFKDKTQKAQGTKFAQFLIISIIGAIINSSIVYLGATFIEPLFGLSPQLWANVVKIFATGASLIWNFLGYKFIVFKK